MFKLNNLISFLKILQLLLIYTETIIGGKLDDYGQIQPTAYILASPLQGGTGGSNNHNNNNNSTLSNDSFAVASQLQSNFVYQPSLPLSPYNYYYNTESPPHYPVMADESYRYPSYYYQTVKKKSSKGSSSHSHRPSSSSSSSSSSRRVKKRRHSTSPASYYRRYHQQDEIEDENEDEVEDNDEDEGNQTEDAWGQGQGHSNNEYKTHKGRKHKKNKHKKNKGNKDNYYNSNDYDLEDNFLGLGDSINSILDYPDDLLGGGGGGGGIGDDLLFGDYDDALQEETFVRPSILGLNKGVNLAAAGLGGLHGIGPGLGLGLGGALTGLLGSSFRTFGVRRLIRNGIRIFIAILLLPLLLLFIPIPIVSSNTNNNNSRDKQENDGSNSGGPNQLTELSRKMISSASSILQRVADSEQCVERISCEIRRQNRDTWLHSLIKLLIFQYEPQLPQSLQRMAKAYVQHGKCKHYNCFIFDNNENNSFEELTDDNVITNL